MAINHQQLGKRIQELRKAAALTQDELSDRAGLSYSTLAKIERGAIKNPSVFTVVSIADSLQLKVEDLMQRPAASPPITGGKVKFFYCDINGVLVRFFQRAFTAIAHETNLPLDKIETTFWHYNDAANRGEMTMKEYNAAMAEKLDMPNFDWQKLYLGAIEPINEMADLLGEVQKTTKIGLLSNIHPGFIKEMINRGILPNLPYDTIIDSSEVGAIKPEQKIYQLAEKAASASGNEILFVDDSRTNLMAAERMGWRVLWFDDYRPQESVQRVIEALNN